VGREPIVRPKCAKVLAPFRIDHENLLAGLQGSTTHHRPLRGPLYHRDALPERKRHAYFARTRRSFNSRRSSVFCLPTTSPLAPPGWREPPVARPFSQAGIAVPDAKDLSSSIQARPDDGADRRVHAGRIPAARQNSEVRRLSPTRRVGPPATIGDGLLLQFAVTGSHPRRVPRLVAADNEGHLNVLDHRQLVKDGMRGLSTSPTDNGFQGGRVDQGRLARLSDREVTPGLDGGRGSTLG